MNHITHKQKQIGISIISLLIVFGLGYMTGSHKAVDPTNGQAFSRQGGVRMGARTGQFGGAVRGIVLSMDGATVTVKTQDGGSKIVILSSSTKISKSVAGLPTDVATGSPVMIFGQANTDGSVNAESVQLQSDQPKN